MEKSEYDLGARELWKTRANVAELIATRLLKWYEQKDLINALFFEFTPTQVGTSTPEPSTPPAEEDGAYGADDDDYLDPNDVWPESAMSLAIDTHSIRFTHHPLVQRAINQIWSGRILLVREEVQNSSDSALVPDENASLLFGVSASRISHRQLGLTDGGGGEGTILTQLKTPRTLSTRRKAARDMISLENLFDVGKLRIPLYQYVIRLSFMLTFLVVYTVVVFARPVVPDFWELTLAILSLAYLADELKAAWDGGLKIYFGSIWNWLDIGCLGLLASFYITRWIGFVKQSDDLRELAFNLLAVANCFIWPRAFAALDRIRYFGIMLITVKHMLYSSSLFFVLMFVNLIGSTQGLYAVSRRENPDPDAADPPSWFRILYELILVWLGFYFRALDFAAELPDPVFAQILVVLFLFTTNLVLLNLLISIFAQSFTSILENADAEFEYSLALRIVEHALGDDLYAYLPPLNLVELAVTPMRYILPKQSFQKANRLLLQVVASPILLAIWLAELYSIWRKTEEDWQSEIEEQQWFQNPADTEGWEDPETGERRAAVEGLGVHHGGHAGERDHQRLSTGNSMDKVTVLPVRKSGSSIRFADGVEDYGEEEEGCEEDMEETSEVDQLKALLATLIKETRSINERLQRLEERGLDKGDSTDTAAVGKDS